MAFWIGEIFLTVSDIITFLNCTVSVVSADTILSFQPSMCVFSSVLRCFMYLLHKVLLNPSELL